MKALTARGRVQICRAAECQMPRLAASVCSKKLSFSWGNQDPTAVSSHSAGGEIQRVLICWQLLETHRGF